MDAGSNAHRHAVFRRVMGTRQRESSNPAPDYGEFRRFSLRYLFHVFLWISLSFDDQ
jgi:hypothetical protein